MNSLNNLGAIIRSVISPSEKTNKKSEDKKISSSTKVSASLEVKKAVLITGITVGAAGSLLTLPAQLLGGSLGFVVAHVIHQKELRLTFMDAGVKLGSFGAAVLFPYCVRELKKANQQ